VGYAQRVSALVIAVFSAHAVLWGDPGFGSLRKKKISLPVRQPAAVRLANSSIAFTGSPSSPAYARVQENLISTLETEMLGNEKPWLRKRIRPKRNGCLGFG
jgi:hypothetical protein